MMKKIGYYFPFTVPGTVSFGFIMYLIGAGYTRKNPYALFLAFAGLFILLILAVLARIQAYRLGKEQLIWDSGSALYAGREGSAERFYTGGFTNWFFFRTHVRVRGSLNLGKGIRYGVLRESSFTGEGALELPLSFPCTGIFTGEGVYTVKDVFGLVRARGGEAVSRSIPVQPSLLPEDYPLKIEISGGEDDTQPRKSSDEEKYYQREYMPGDRFRDINWKATSKIGEMFTRISPVTEEKTKLVLIDFRHFSPDSRFTADHTAHMEYLKRWCITFLWKLKTSQPEFQFIVYTGLGSMPVEESRDIQRLSIGLSSLFYHHDPKLHKDLNGIGEVYIFTTPFDTGLGGVLTQYSGKRVSVFSTVFPRKGASAETEQEDPEYISFLPKHRMAHIPGMWIVTRAGRNGGPAGGAHSVQVRRSTRAVEGRIR